MLSQPGCGRLRIRSLRDVTVSPALAEYAESPSVFSIWPAGFRRVLTERYCVVLGTSRFFSEVQQPRLADAIEETVEEVRALARESGHVSSPAS